MMSTKPPRATSCHTMTPYQAKFLAHLLHMRSLDPYQLADLPEMYAKAKKTDDSLACPRFEEKTSED